MKKLFRKTMKLFLLCIILIIFLSRIISEYIHVSDVIYIPLITIIISDLLYFLGFEKLYENVANEKNLIILPSISVLIVKVTTLNIYDFKILCLNLLFILLGGIINLNIKKIYMISG